MKTLRIIGMVPLVLISATSFGQGGDNRAVPRSSGGGGSSSSAGARHTGGSSSGSSSGSSAGSSSNSGGNSGSSAQGGGSRYNDSASGAAQRRPRPGTGTGTRDRYGNDYNHYSSYPYSNYYYNPYYAYSWGYPGRYGRYGYGYGYYDYGYSYGDYYGYYPQSYNRPYGYRTGNAGNVAQLRILVEPAKARVYVDGYYAGIVDDFDGLTQRLNVSPGRHDITFKLEGYTSHTFSTNANPDQTLKLRFDMVRGGGETRDSIGEAYDRRPEPDQGRESDSARYSPPGATDHSLEVDSVRADRPYVPPSRETERGELLLEIEPADASVYVDGQFFGKASQVTRLELAAGRHRIEVVRPGYRTRETEVDITGEAKRVAVKLER